MREARSGEANGGGKKELFIKTIKVYKKFPLQSMPLFWHVRTYFYFLSQFYESQLTKIDSQT